MKKKAPFDAFIFPAGKKAKAKAPRQAPKPKDAPKPTPKPAKAKPASNKFAHLLASDIPPRSRTAAPKAARTPTRAEVAARIIAAGKKARGETI